jgi:hypothetical protein
LAFAVSTGHFSLKLVGESIQFLLGHAERFGVVAQNAFGRALNAALEIVDGCTGALAGLSRLFEKIFSQ